MEFELQKSLYFRVLCDNYIAIWAMKIVLSLREVKRMEKFEFVTK